MPSSVVCIYLYEKYKHETRLENYITDMLWAPANGMQFKNSKRYSEFNNKNNNEKPLDGKEILNELVNAW